MNNYKTCPLKKRPVFYVEPAVEIAQDQNEPQDLSLKRKAEDECQSEAKRNFALNLTTKSDFYSCTRPESPSCSETSRNSYIDNSYSPPSSDRDYPNIHLRGVSPISYKNEYVQYNPMTAVWNNFSNYGVPAPVYNYHHMTPPSSPGSSSSFSEPEDLSIRNDIPLPALYHVFSEAPTATSVSQKSYRFKCDVCSKMYSTSIGLAKHQQYHCNQEKKHHSCEECGKVYTTMGALKMHIRTHTLPCKCPICGKAFSRPWLLQGHIRTHTGEKPFQCSDCNRSFADRSNLRAHQQTHVDVKKYVCNVCNKSFSRMSLLNKHANSNCTITIV
ncbi:protein snail [Eupeodes corollae]|uniref:protein snail n=1 Tax=Eupeodes corollae TaxID=290404 RepID=UPI0024901E1B|nr:protein snail [Eupeodes corollae]